MIASIADRWPVGLLGVMFLVYAGFGIRGYIRRYHRKPPPPPGRSPHA